VTSPIGRPFDKTYTEFADTPELISCGNLAGLTAIGKTYQSLTTFHTRRPPLVTKLRA
jgi:hypothetical protein